MRRQVRLGIVGAGMIGRAHVRACLECARAAITAVCDTDAGRARALATEFGVPHVFSDHRKLLAEAPVDAVLVCTPNNTHMPIAVAALKAGKDVLCEKPLAMNGQQARRMVRAAKEADRILMVGQSARYGNSVGYLKKLADAGRFGEIYYGKALWLRRAGIPRGWFQDMKQSGGGPLIDLGVHAVDLLWWLMGHPKPESAYGVTFDRLGRSGQGMGDWGVGYAPAKFSVEDMVGAMVRFADGRSLSIDISWAAHTSDLYWLRIFGTKGGAQTHPEAVIYQSDAEVKLDTTVRFADRNSYVAENQHFIHCVLNRTEPLSPGSQAVVVTDMLDAIAKSARTGRMVRIRTA